MYLVQGDRKKVILALILVFTASAGTRLAFLYFAASGTYGNSDTAGYQGLADSLLSSWKYTTEQPSGAPGAFPADLQRPPGYPFFLYLINPSSGVNRAWVAAVQSMLGGFFAVFLTIVVARLINLTVGMMAGLFYRVRLDHRYSYADRHRRDVIHDRPDGRGGRLCFLPVEPASALLSFGGRSIGRSGPHQAGGAGATCYFHFGMGNTTEAAFKWPGIYSHFRALYHALDDKKLSATSGLRALGSANVKSVFFHRSGRKRKSPREGSGS